MPSNTPPKTNANTTKLIVVVLMRFPSRMDETSDRLLSAKRTLASRVRPILLSLFGNTARETLQTSHLNVQTRTNEAGASTPPCVRGCSLLVPKIEVQRQPPDVQVLGRACGAVLALVVIVQHEAPLERQLHTESVTILVPGVGLAIEEQFAPGRKV